MTLANGVITKQRSERGCGFRKAGGLYLFGKESLIHYECDRLPLEIPTCPRCGERIRFSRGIQNIDFTGIFEDHYEDCTCLIECPACKPEGVFGHLNETDDAAAWLMWVGKDYTTDSFIQEAISLGVSKRIPQIPKGFVVNKDWVFLARYNGGKRVLSVIIDGRETRMSDVIFYAFKPTHIELLVTEGQSQDQEYIDKLLEKGITPVLEKSIIIQDEDQKSAGKGSETESEALEDSLGKTE